MIKSEEIMVSCGEGVYFKNPHELSLHYLYKAMTEGEIVNSHGIKISIRNPIEAIRILRKEGNDQKANEIKRTLFACTISGIFFGGKRKQEAFQKHSGRLQIDIDKIGIESAESLKDLLRKDHYIEFAAISPSGDGLKAVISIPPCNSNEEQHHLFIRAQKYFKSNYDVEIDESTKDVTRLFFLTYDPKAYVAVETPKILEFKDFQSDNMEPLSHFSESQLSETTKESAFTQKLLDQACHKIGNACDGKRHDTRLKQARLIGGYVGGGHLQETEALQRLKEAALSNTENSNDAKQSIQDGFENGKLAPIDLLKENVHSKQTENSKKTQSISSMYIFNEEGTFRLKQTKDGQFPVQLANFQAKIKEEQVYDDGERNELHYVIEGEQSGCILPSLIVRAERFPSLDFVAKYYGCRAQILPYSKDHLRHSIQVRSGNNVPRSRVFQHTGIRELDGKLTYLSTKGGIDQVGVQVCLGDKGNHRLQRYALPLKSSSEELESGINASLDFLKLAEFRVSMPLFAATYASIIFSEIEDHFASLYLLGPTGSRKTAIAVSALNHHGNFTSDELFTFNDTHGSLEVASYILKDTLMLVDDFYPTRDRQNQQRMISTFESLTRSAGNRSGKGRLKSNLSLQHTYYPRGLVIFTGEDLNGATSALARLMLVKVENGDINLEKLSNLQKKHHYLPHATADFFRWWRDHRESAQALFTDKSLEIELNNKYSKKLHGRLPRQIALWLRMVEVLCFWLIDRKFLTPSEAEMIKKASLEVFVKSALDLQTYIQTSNPSQLFLEVIQSLNASGKLWFKEWKSNDRLAQKEGELFGYRRDGYVYAQAETLWHLIQIYYQREGGSFPVGKKALLDNLARDGILEKQGSESTQSLKVPTEGGKYMRLVKLRADQLLGETLISSTQRL